MPFQPRRVMFEQSALDYPLGQKLREYFSRAKVPVSIIGSHNRVTGIPGKTPQEIFSEAKATLVFGVRKTLDFETCKPSAHYQLPLSTGCGGKCEYCYLMTTLGKKPYQRAYVNVGEILSKAKEYIEKRSPEITIFEGAATSDPIPVEPYTGALGQAIKFFSAEPLGRFRFVTKFTDVDSLLDLEHGGHTVVRFSLNSERVIKQWEHGTPSAAERIAAANKILEAGYPLGFIIAPIFLYENWQQDYRQLLEQIRSGINGEPYSFEFITHRFTSRAKNRIQEVFPKTSLPMVEEERKYKYGQFGYGKYVYQPDQHAEVKQVFTEWLSTLFPTSKLEYFV